MNELQSQVVTWLSILVASLPVSYPFGAGMIAAVNPCGFAMLPAYLSLYLGIDDRQIVRGSIGSRLMAGIQVGSAVSAGFVALFAFAGLLISIIGIPLMRSASWFGAVIGSVLILAGLLLLLDRLPSPAFFEQLAARVSRPGNQTRRGFFLFGLGYGLASLSCTLPVFMIAVGSALTSGDLLGGVASFLSYGLGMATVILTLTLALSFVKVGMVSVFRRSMRYVQTASAVLLIVAGGWIMLYWWPALTT